MCCVAVLEASAGCNALRDRWEDERREEELGVCASGDSSTRFDLAVFVPGNLDSCTELEDSGCYVSVDGGRIDLDAWAEVRVKVASKGEPRGVVSCTSEEHPILIDCEVPEVPPGPYTIFVESQPEAPMLEVEWPWSSRPPPACFGE